ncbi:sporulation related protein [Arcicella aurantiaca]|uniref:Sporulation related protein n=1 Tax=Arcicella aurantiaca TaxID=591202 RepID=A0A316DRY1_9BACT|nr:SPOR domain-containing protein [Arcicella aurantiaca]PWK20238.1 sporulation related protein [Arcicella aurantiaca]
MTTVQNHIKELLFEQDCVVIPDFGGFVTNFDCAKVDLTNRFFTPPQKWLAFNSLLKNDDGLLSNYIATQEGISREQATQKVRAFVEETKRYISYDKNYTIEGLGTFSQNEESKIQFQPKTSNNFFSESFGMETVFLKKLDASNQELQVVHTPPVASNTTIQQVFASKDREPMAEVMEDEAVNAKRKGKFSRVLPAIYGLFGTAILVSALYLYDNPKANLSSLNPFQSQSIVKVEAKPVVQKTEVVAPNIDATIKAKPFEGTEVTPEPVIETKKTIIESEKRFFVITGSFGSKKNAQKLLNALKNKGFEDAKLIFPKHSEKLIKVSAGGFANEFEAESEALKVNNATSQSTWIYKK